MTHISFHGGESQKGKEVGRSVQLWGGIKKNLQLTEVETGLGVILKEV